MKSAPWIWPEAWRNFGERGSPAFTSFRDAVLSSFVKGEVSPAVSEPLRILGRLLTGTAVGRLCDQALVPPLVKDFEEQCRAFRPENPGECGQSGGAEYFYLGQTPRD